MLYTVVLTCVIRVVSKSCHYMDKESVNIKAIIKAVMPK